MSTEPTFPVTQATERVLIRVAERPTEPKVHGFGALADAIELGHPSLSRDAALVEMAAWCIEQLAQQRQEERK